MRGFLRAGLVVLCLMLVLVQGVPAFTVSRITIDPSGSVLPGNTIVVTGTIDFTPFSDTTFNRSHQLRFSTDLERSTWNWTLVINDTKTSRPAILKNDITLSGETLSYPKNVYESLKFRLTGTAPGVECTSNKTFIRIEEINEQGIPVPGTSCEYSRVIVNICNRFVLRDRTESALYDFKSHIKEKAAIGVNSTLAEEKYIEAEEKIRIAKALPQAQYMEGYKFLDSAQRDIDDGEMLLDKTWAEKEVADAQVPINNVDTIIAWFKGNASTRDDAQLPAIVAKREAAASYLATANDQIENGDYGPARVSAQTAALLATDSLEKISIRKNYISNGAGCGWCINPFSRFVLPVAGFIAIIICVAGISWWRKHTK